MNVAPLRPAHAALLREFSPVQAAAQLQHLAGFVFFDSALAKPGAAPRSILAAEPVTIIAGEMNRDWPRLTAALRTAPPDRFAAGYAGYDGRFEFAFYEQALVYDHATRVWHGWGDLATKLRPAADSAPPSLPLRFESRTTPAEFCRAVARAQEYIAAGDIYQVNLAHQWRSPWAGDAFTLYECLRECSPAPHAAFLRMSGRTLLSSSPELFLQMVGRHIRTRPIKGTRPRHNDPQADEKSSYDLLTSPKEIAELVMITDLERNDLGQVCEWGSVAVRELLAIERFAQVFHLVSTVEGRLRPEVDHATAFRECFPGGSITGAPKKRAREIIAELEPHPRGVYTGALGWFGLGGESQFNIAIRTLVLEGAEASFHTGAGIVADSEPRREWQETLDKAAGLLLAAKRYGHGAPGVPASGREIPNPCLFWPPPSVLSRP